MMRIKSFILVLVLGFLSNGVFASDPIRFKIQCASSVEKLPAKQLEKVKDLSTYTLQSGRKIYFAGDFHTTLSEADSALQVIEDLGFQKACIRVFKGNVLLGRIESDSYILSLRLKDEQLNEGLLLKPKKEAIEVPVEKDTIADLVKDSVVNEAEPDVEIEEQSTAANVVVMKDQPDSLERGTGSSIVVNSSLVASPPVFSIYLANIPKGSPDPDIVTQFENETIFVFDQNDRLYYLVGKFENDEAAFSALKKYKEIVPNAEVVAQYRERVIGLELAKELYERYHNFPPRY